MRAKRLVITDDASSFLGRLERNGFPKIKTNRMQIERVQLLNKMSREEEKKQYRTIFVLIDSKTSDLLPISSKVHFLHYKPNLLVAHLKMSL